MNERASHKARAPAQRWYLRKSTRLAKCYRTR